MRLGLIRGTENVAPLLSITKQHANLNSELGKEGPHDELSGPDVRLDVEGRREPGPLLGGSPRQHLARGQPIDGWRNTVICRKTEMITAVLTAT